MIHFDVIYLLRSFEACSSSNQFCYREDLYDPGWSSGDDANVPLIAVLVSVSVGCAAVAILASGTQFNRRHSA